MFQQKQESLAPNWRAMKFSLIRKQHSPQPSHPHSHLLGVCHVLPHLDDLPSLRIELLRAAVDLGEQMKITGTEGIKDRKEIKVGK